MASPTTFWARRRAGQRGVGLRLVAMVLGALVAAAGIVAMQLPLLSSAATVRASLGSLPLGPLVASPAWPAVGSAALYIPQLGIAESSSNEVLPIASITKLMTAYVVLQRWPLAPDATGPCFSVNQADATAFYLMKDSDQSSVAVVAGEHLCENQLLEGLLVHSASNYAAMLADLTWGSQTAFIEQMNRDAASLGLTGTHYVDVSGFNAGSVSTALDQARLAALLMASPVLRADVAMTSVALPVAGVVTSFTPDVGSYGVIGVKSGRTTAAGGCDVMARVFTYNGAPLTVYAVVLGQSGGDLLGPAGAAALALSSSAVASPIGVTLPIGTVVGHVRWGSERTRLVLVHTLRLAEAVSTTTTPTSSVTPSVSYALFVHPFTHAVKPGDVVGYVRVRFGAVTKVVGVTVRSAIGPISLWQRLR